MSRQERLAACLKDGEAALSAAALERAQAVFAQAARLAHDLEAHAAQACALLGAARTSLARGDRDGAARLAGDAVVTLELAGSPSADALDVLCAAGGDAAIVVVERALEHARHAARADDHAALSAVGDALLLRLLKGAGPAAVLKVSVELCTCAIVVDRADLCARWMFAAAGAMRAAADVALRAQLERAADLMAAALARADVEPVVDDEGGALDPADVWAFALAELLVEVSRAALEPLRIVRAHLVCARLLLDGGRASEARASARAALGLSRVLGLGDNDPLGAEAAALVAAADERAPLVIA